MAGDDLVVLDGVEQATHQRRVSIPWGWLATGFGAGLLFAVVFVSPLLEVDLPVDSSLVSDENQVAVGVGAEIPGFPDPMIAVVESEARSFQMVRWPVNGPETRHPVPAGDFGEVAIDVSGHWLAATTPVPGVDWVVLSVGRSTSVFPLASSVTSFAWHDSEEGALAFSRRDGDTWSLWRVGSDRHPVEVASFEGVDWSIVAWGDWGYAMDDQPGPSLLLTPSGELRGTSFEGVFYDSTPDGWLFGVSDDAYLVSAGGGVRKLDLPSPLVGEIEAAALDPAAEKLALLGPTGLFVTAIDGDAGAASLNVGIGKKMITWSSDGRFVMVPGFRGLVVYDTSQHMEHYVLAGDVVEVVVAAKSGS